MVQANKKTSKKTARKKAPSKSASAKNLPQSTEIPQGMKQMGGGYAPSWKPENIGDSLQAVVTSLPREVEFKQGRKTVQRNVIEVTDMAGNRHAVWQSAALGELFDLIAALGEDGIGLEIFLCYDGEGKKKPGQNPPKLYTVAIAE